MFILQGPERPVVGLVFAPDATKLYASCALSGVHVWNLADRTSELLTISETTVVEMSTISPGGRWGFGLRSRQVSGAELFPSAFDLTAGNFVPFNFIGFSTGSVALVPNASHFMTLGHVTHDPIRQDGGSGQRLYRWHMTDDGPQYERHQDIRTFTFGITALDSERFVTLESAAPPAYSFYQPARAAQLVVRNANDASAITSLDFPDSLMQQLLASPDGRQFIARRGTELHIWDASDWSKPPRVIDGKYKEHMTERAACFHPSGQYLLLANGGPSMLVFDTTAWKQVRKWKWDIGALRAVAISPDGALAAAAGPSGKIVVWDLDL